MNVLNTKMTHDDMAHALEYWILQYHAITVACLRHEVNNADTRIGKNNLRAGQGNRKTRFYLVVCQITNLA